MAESWSPKNLKIEDDQGCSLSPQGITESWSPKNFDLKIEDDQSCSLGTEGITKSWSPKEKKNRSKNFSNSEEEELVALILKYKDTIESKKSDLVTWKAKQNAWEQLREEFNCRLGGVPRSVESLKTKYDAIKKNTRKKSWALEREAYRTGGGVSTAPPLTQVEEKVKSVILLSVDRLMPLGDNDSIAFGEYETDEEEDKKNCLLEDITEVTNSPPCETHWRAWNPSQLRTRISSSLHTARDHLNVPGASQTKEKVSEQKKRIHSVYEASEKFLRMTGKLDQETNLRMKILQKEYEEKKEREYEKFKMLQEEHNMKRKEHLLRCRLLEAQIKRVSADNIL